jgi:hypothetical protein
LSDGVRLRRQSVPVICPRGFNNRRRWKRQFFRESLEIVVHTRPRQQFIVATVLLDDGEEAPYRKLANQIIVALNIAAMSEALVLASKAGVSPDLVYQAIRGGLAGSTVLDAKAPLVMDRKFHPGFRINLHIKDLANVLETSHEIGVPLPLTASVMEMMQALKADGLGDLDHCGRIRYYEKMAKVEVKR